MKRSIPQRGLWFDGVVLAVTLALLLVLFYLTYEMRIQIPIGKDLEPNYDGNAPELYAVLTGLILGVSLLITVAARGAKSLARQAALAQLRQVGPACDPVYWAGAGAISRPI